MMWCDIHMLHMYTYVLYTCIWFCNVLHIMHILWSLCIQKATKKPRISGVLAKQLLHMGVALSEVRILGKQVVQGFRSRSKVALETGETFEINQQQLFQLPLKLTQPVCQCRGTKSNHQYPHGSHINRELIRQWTCANWKINCQPSHWAASKFGIVSFFLWKAVIAISIFWPFLIFCFAFCSQIATFWLSLLSVRWASGFGGRKPFKGDVPMEWRVHRFAKALTVTSFLHVSPTSSAISTV